MVWVLKHFRDLVFGYSVHILTDHGLAVEFFKNKKHTSLLARWYLTKQYFIPTFEYLEGKTKTAVNAPSREVALVPPEYGSFDEEEVVESQLCDPQLCPIMLYLEGGIDSAPNMVAELSKEIILRSIVLHRRTAFMGGGLRRRGVAVVGKRRSCSKCIGISA